MALPIEADDSGNLGFVIDKVSFLKQVPLLNKATADNETPTPGYLYQEVNNITFQSGSYCRDLLCHLVDKLDRKSYHVKLKVLRVMRFLVENGHPDFRQGLRRRALGIQEATKFSGPPDQLHGNAPYLMVRKEAKELSQILFEVGSQDSDMPVPPATKLTHTGGMGGESTGVLQGFGNTTPKPKSLGETMMTGLRQLADKVLDGGLEEDERTRPSLKADRNFGSYQATKLPDSLLTDTQQMSVSVEPGAGAQTRPGRRAIKGHRRGVAGGGWEDADEEDATVAAAAAAGGSVENTSVGPEAAESASLDSTGTDNTGSERLENGKCSDEWSGETQLVNTAMQAREGNAGNPGLLPRSQMQAFVKQCAKLNCDRVINLLNIHLKGTEQQAMTGMLLLDGLLHTDLVPADQMAQSCHVNLLHLYSQQGPVQAKARKILRILEKLCTQPGLFEGLPQSTESCREQSAHRTRSELIPGTGGSAAQLSSSAFPFLNAPFSPSAAAMITTDLAS